jgi:hypothetical protein
MLILRRLNRPLNRRLDRSSDRYSTRMFSGVHRPPPVNYLRLACRALSLHIRIAKRLAKQWPEIFDNVANQRRAIELERQHARDAEVLAALKRVYDPDFPVLPGELGMER